MASEVTIPNLGHTMTVAKIVRFIKSVGDSIGKGEPLVEIETDKVTYEVESTASGTIRLILVEEGDEVPVGGIVAIVGCPDEKVDAALYQPTGEVSVKNFASTSDIPTDYYAPPSVLTTTALREPGGVRASPLAKKVAKLNGVDLQLVQGSGAEGRIRTDDVERYMRERNRAGTAVGPGDNGKPRIAEEIPLTSMRKTIAERLTRNSRDIPHFYQFIEVDMAEAMKLRSCLLEPVETEIGVRITLTDVFVKAVSCVLRDHMRLNARLNGTTIEVLQDINMGIAVALDNGLTVPSVLYADTKRISEIARERSDLVERARQGRLSLDELERGTFTISNLGMYDILSFTSIINAPQSCILSIGRVIERPVVRDGKVVIQPIVEIGLAADHRVVDGAITARFLQDLKHGIENPYRLF